MKARLLASIGALLALAISAPSLCLAQPPAADQAEPAFSAAQIDQLVAPIALYPDPVLSEVLMAASYPVEVVEAERWRQDPANAALSGDALSAALDQQSWDPSVKSLVFYPQILRMMDGDLDWTEALGEAFIADPDTVMDEIQKLRREAQATGRLASNAKVVVTDEEGDIDIEPADPSQVYVPSYNPTVVFAPWPYPDFPPYYFPGYFDGCVIADFDDCWIAWPIFAPYWGWDHWDWRQHHIHIDRDRFERLDHGRPPGGGDIWQHDPAHRRGAPYQSPATRERFPTASGAPNVQRAIRGFPVPAAQAPRPANATHGPPAQAPPPHAPPTFESYDRGGQARTDAARGASSRVSVPSYMPHGGGPSGGGFRGGGGAAGGGRSGGGGRR